MCNPAVFVAAGMSAQAAAVASAVTAATAAATTVAKNKKQQKIQIKQQENQAEAAVVNYNYAQKNLENKMISEQDAVENELFNKNIEAANARASVNAQNTGVAGATVDALSNDVDATFGRQINDINKNFDIQQQGNQSQSDADYRTLQSTLTGLGGDVAGPGFLDSAIKIGGAGASGYAGAQNSIDKTQSGYLNKQG